MKRVLISLLSVYLLHSLLFAAGQIISLKSGNDNSLTLKSRSATGLTLELSLNQIAATESETPWGTFTTLHLPHFEGQRLEIGKAFLPEVHQLIDVPYGAEVQVRVISAESQEINLTEYGFQHPILPYQGPIEKTENAIQQHTFQMDQAYYHSVTYDELPLATYQEVGNLRGHILGQVRINAVQYLPAQNKVRIYTHVVVEVTFLHPNWAETRAIHQKYQSPYFDTLLREFTINFESTRSDLTQYPVNYLIIYYDSFYSELQQFIAWKKQKGFNVKAVAISTIGNNYNAIKNYIQNEYNGANPPSFVVLVGDKEQIATGNGQTGGHVTDLYYTTMTAGDFVPDIYIGRLSAQVVPQLTAQLDKILPYEKYQLPNTAFLNHGCFVATDDSWNYQIAEGTHNYVIDTHFIPNGLQYDKLYAITYNATGQQVINAVNDGRFILNYSGHGSETSWGGPSVSQSMVNTTTNQDKYPFVISNACMTGSFQVTECFGETWVRKANGGGLAFTGASNSTYWDEDDEWERRAYDGVFWENYHTLAAFIFRGNLGVLNAGYNRAHYYFEVYHLFGDPSLMLYWGEPSAMTANYANVVFLGSPSFDITVAGEDSALVSLYMDGQIYGTALTDANGYAQVQLNPVPTTPGTMVLTVTKFNRQPLIDSLQVIPASGPYLYCIQPVVDDASGNNNGIPEAGETFSMQFLLTNVGVDAAQDVQASLSTTDTLVEILTSQTTLGTINAGDTVTVGSIDIHIKPETEHLHMCQLNLHMADNSGNSWDQILFITIRKGAYIEVLTPSLSFPPTFLNFSSDQNLRIGNSGPDTLFIYDIQSDIPQFSVANPQVSVAPGAEVSIPVSFTPTDTMVYNATLTVYNSDPMHFQTTFTATGTGIFAPDIAFYPDSISRTLNVTDSVVIPVIVKNEGLGELVYNAQIAGYPPSMGSPIEGSGGADNFGHIWIDSDESSGPEFQWFDITSSGTALPLTGNNAISDEINIGFDFPYYGNLYNKVRVCTNGWLSFTTYSVAYNNISLPNVLAPRSMIAALWDDLFFNTDSKAYVKAESNKLIIEYQNVYTVTGGGPYTFEVILYDNGNIVLQYLSLQNLETDYTVGIQNQAADDGLTIAYNQVYLKDSLAVLISKHSWATVSPMAGTVAPMAQDTLYLTLRTENFPTGEFWATIQVESNDPDEGLAYVPIHMVVDTNFTAIAGNISGIPTRFVLHQNWPNPFNPTTTISYALPQASRVELAVFNVLGQRVKTLVQAHQNAGRYRVQWDGTNEQNQPVASGIYIYRLVAGDRIAIRKMILMK